MNNNFKLCTLLDLVTFGGVNMVPTFCLIYSLCYKLRGAPLYGMIATTACFWLVFGAYLLARKLFLNKITFITKQQVGVITNDFAVKQADAEAEIDQTIAAWDVACKFNKSAETLDGAMVEFQTFPVADAQGVKLAGFTIGNSCCVGWKTDLKETAFQHELGHIIHIEYYGSANNDACHLFMKQNNLP
jgi:hypothetical protein